MEISSGRCRSPVEEVKNIERGLLRELHILCGEELFLYLLPEVMPGQKESLVAGEVGYFEPFMDTHFAPASGADGIRHKIAEGTVFVDPPEGIESAEARPEGVNTAAAVGTEKGTGVCLFVHKEVREHEPAVNMKPDARIQELSEACAEVLTEQTDIIGVQVDRVVHTAAAFAAAFAGAAGYAGKIMGSEAVRHFIFLHRHSVWLDMVTCRTVLYVIITPAGPRTQPVSRNGAPTNCQEHGSFMCSMIYLTYLKIVHSAANGF